MRTLELRKAGASVSVSSDGALYIVSLRDINTVVAFSTSTGEVAWSISSSASDGIPSTLSFAAKDQTFYDVHDAQLIGTDKLLLMDDGNNREAGPLRLRHAASRATQGKGPD